jgi:hypothetical protein
LQGTAGCSLKTLQIASTIFAHSVNLLNGLGILHGRLIYFRFGTSRNLIFAAPVWKGTWTPENS